METVDFQQILTAARQLPKPSQAQLVSALLQEEGQAPKPALVPSAVIAERVAVARLFLPPP
jgi:hypothetical protein